MPAVNNAEEFKKCAVGDYIEGWVVAGNSPGSGKVLLVEPKNLSMRNRANFFRGQQHAKDLESKGHPGARLPSILELEVIFMGIVRGGYNERLELTTIRNSKFISSSDARGIVTWHLDMNNGNEECLDTNEKGYIRCVRNADGYVIG